MKPNYNRKSELGLRGGQLTKFKQAKCLQDALLSGSILQLRQTICASPASRECRQGLAPTVPLCLLSASCSPALLQGSYCCCCCCCLDPRTHHCRSETRGRDVWQGLPCSHRRFVDFRTAHSLEGWSLSANDSDSSTKCCGRRQVARCCHRGDRVPAGRGEAPTRGEWGVNGWAHGNALCDGQCLSAQTEPTDTVDCATSARDHNCRSTCWSSDSRPKFP
mmetsp:Transcript_3237/g.7683  ORF Transcript_3237/g.7683 Transcript_3237/m.7683 type:complete len:220 (+) Transcript_3237:168-827(+)